MKRVLITGAGSYVGGWVRRRLEQEPERFYVEELDVQDDAWKSFDFSSFDSVFHVAGIAHVSTDPSMEGLYYQVNRDLAVEVGERAKAAGVSQLVFMSSSIVYGDSSNRDEGPITREIPANPANFYGRSKLEAEEGLQRLADDQFNVAILRCPMIYGPGCKGNFPTLAKIARKLPIFPEVRNKRSVLYVENLAEFVAQVVDRGLSGMFWPQNADYMSTSEAVRLLGEAQGSSVRMTRVLSPFASLALRFTEAGRKAFGSLYYDMAISDYGFDYRVFGFEESIVRYINDGEEAL